MTTYYNPKDVFYNQHSALGLVGMEFETDETVVPSRLDFADNTSQQNIDLVTAAATSWDWAPLPTPDPNGFVENITADNSLIAVLYLLMPYYAAIQNYALAPAAIKAVWAQIKIQLPPNLVTTIEGYAVKYNMPLV